MFLLDNSVMIIGLLVLGLFVYRFLKQYVLTNRYTPDCQDLMDSYRYIEKVRFAHTQNRRS